MRPLDPQMLVRWNRARAQWPDVEVPAEIFGDYVLERGRWEELSTDHLYLACACARNQPKALAAFETTFFGEVDAACRKLRNASITPDDARQAVRVHLFMGNPPRITGFSGKGSLKTWLRIVATRTLLNMVRAKVPQLGAEEDLADLPMPEDAPELASLKRSFGPSFKAAFREALRGAASRDRNLIRFMYVDGLSAEEIGTLYGVHGATIRRWMTSAREDLIRSVTERLRADFKLGAKELQSVLKQVRSGLSITLSQLASAVPAAQRPRR